MSRRRGAPPAPPAEPGAAPPAIPCFDRALRLLAGRAHFRRELALKLTRRGYGGEEVDAALARLAAAGLLDDEACARGLAEGPYRRKGLGPLRVRSELRRRGAAEELAERVVADAYPDGGREAALAVARRWIDRRGGDGARLARHLAGKGFGESVVRDALRRLGLRWSAKAPPEGG